MKLQRTKKLLALNLICTIALGTTACGSTGAETSGTNADPAGQNTESEDAVTDTSADGRTVIEFFNQKTEIVDILNTLIAEYEAEHTDIKIELVTPADAGTVLNSRMASNDTPDIFTNWPSNTFFESVDSGYVMDLSATGIMDNIQDASREQWKHNDGEYAATISYNCSGIWYNMDLLEQAGITKIPATWDELIADCETLQAAGITPFVASGKEVAITDRYLQVFLASAMGSSYEEFETDASAGTVDAAKGYNTPLQSIGEKMLQVISYAQDDVLGCDQDNATANFAKGDGAMMIGGSWLLASVSAANPDINMSMGPIPGNSADETNTCAFPGDFTLCIAADSEVQEQAVEFVKWFTSPETATKYAEAEGNPSCIKGVTYVADAFSDLYNNYVTSGKFILNPDCNWSVAQQNASGSAVQQLYYDQDVSAFPELLADAFNNN